MPNGNPRDRFFLSYPHDRFYWNGRERIRGTHFVIFSNRYIYIPCGGGQHGYARQMLGSGLCFLYVYYWHGAEYYIAVWILLNCIGISLEGVGSVISKIPVVKKLEVRQVYRSLGKSLYLKFEVR